MGVDDEIWGNLLQGTSDGLTDGGTGFRIQLAQFSNERLCLQVTQFQHLLQALPVFLGEKLKIFADGFLHEVSQTGRVAPLNLQQQTFLQRTCSDAGRIELL